MAEPESDTAHGDASTQEVDTASAAPQRVHVTNNYSQKVKLDDREIIASGTIHCRGGTIEIVPLPRYPTGPKIEFTFWDAEKPKGDIRLVPAPRTPRARNGTRNYNYSHICLNWNLLARVWFKESYEVATYRGRKILADVSCDLVELTSPGPLRRFHYTMFYAAPRKPK